MYGAIGFYDVFFLPIVETFDSHSSLEAVCDFSHVVLEAPETGGNACRDNIAAADDTETIATRDVPVADIYPGDSGASAKIEDGSNGCPAFEDILEYRLEHSAQGAFYILEHMIDDIVVSYLDAFFVGECLSTLLREGY